MVILCKQSGKAERVSKKTRNLLQKFGFSLELDKFLTLKNDNIFSFCSLNRNFALSLQPEA